MKFTPKNLIENLDKLGGWSAYGLASSALQHYFPEAYEDGFCLTSNEAQLLPLIGCEYWEDIIVKYHKEVGYKYLNPDVVNEY